MATMKNFLGENKKHYVTPYVVVPSGDHDKKSEPPHFLIKKHSKILSTPLPVSPVPVA